MSHVDELDKLIAETGSRGFNLLHQEGTTQADVTNEFLYAILKALGIIGKILAER
jgi:hypothetical protein